MAEYDPVTTQDVEEVRRDLAHVTDAHLLLLAGMVTEEVRRRRLPWPADEARVAVRERRKRAKKRRRVAGL